MSEPLSINYQELAEKIKLWGKELGFAEIGFSDIDLRDHQAALQAWLDKGYHGDMEYMSRHKELRTKPDLLHPGTITVISARMDYLVEDAKFADTLRSPSRAYISRYALGRDYHKLMRNRLKQLGDKIKHYCQQLDFRPFVDSAPILERPLAEKAGLGWVGKHSLLINEQAGSWFFLGELLVDIPLPTNKASDNQCGSCVACLKICPTQAIIEPYVVDARRCISYLTIEMKGSIPEQYRKLMGNRIYGCDDCQLVCPWNKYGQITTEDDFKPRNNFDHAELLQLFAWTEQQFLDNTQGSPIRRIGYQSWQRNIAVALGNAPYQAEIVDALTAQRPHVCELVAEHIDWALAEQQQNKDKQHSRLTARLIRTIEKGLPRDA
ncbi:tRNA epoxyqueuosine(34) reductase QueG [Thalassotalea maritima]|uniref:tRNA epoxyqueuosine(34) reductase QueG n=1 Tax=Thalassotalea maritima TaxID=3242416 RepID=UPI0035295BDD